MNIVGILSSICLVLCGLPELYRGVKEGNIGASLGLLILWFLGEILGLIYTTYIGDMALIINYGFNTFIVGILLWMKIKN